MGNYPYGLKLFACISATISTIPPEQELRAMFPEEYDSEAEDKSQADANADYFPPSSFLTA